MDNLESCISGFVEPSLSDLVRQRLEYLDSEIDFYSKVLNGPYCLSEHLRASLTASFNDLIVNQCLLKELLNYV